MKQGFQTVGEFATELKRQSEAALDLVAPTRAIRLHTDISTAEATKAGNWHVLRNAPMTIAVGGEVFSVNDRTHRQMATFLGVPVKHYDWLRREQPDLLEAHVNSLLQRNESKRLVRTLDGGARAFLSQTYNVGLSNEALVEYLLPTVMEMGGEVESSAITDAKVHIKVSFPRFQREVRKVGDIIQLGAYFYNSEVGAAKWGFDLFTKNLACLNGMTVENSGFAKQHLGAKLGNGDESVRRFITADTRMAEDIALVKGARDLLKGILTEATLAAHVARLEEALEIPLVEAGAAHEKIVGKVERVTTKAGLLEGERASVLEHLIRGGRFNLYGLAQAVTRTAEDVESYDRATELEKLGGQMVTLPQSRWGIEGEGELALED